MSSQVPEETLSQNKLESNRERHPTHRPLASRCVCTGTPHTHTKNTSNHKAKKEKKGWQEGGRKETKDGGKKGGPERGREGGNSKSLVGKSGFHNEVLS